MHNLELIIKKILKDRPFANSINIVQIEELISTNPHMIFKVRDLHGKFYKLKKYKSSKFAKNIESNIQLVLRFFPKFYGRDRNYLLFDFVQGRTLIKNENLNIIYKIGKMSGEINKYKINNTCAINTAKRKYDKILRETMKFILENKIITPTDYRRILEIYEKLKQEIEYDVVLEICDIGPSNFIIDSKDKLYCIDDKKLFYFIKGYGFARPLLSWFNNEQKKSFFSGYNSVNSIDFFHKDYEKFITLLYYVEKISYRSRVGKDYSGELKRLLKLE